MQRIAVHRRADARRQDVGVNVPAYTFGGDDVDLVVENIKYEFREHEETRLEARFSTSASLFAIWPSADSADTDSFFYIREKDGTLVDRPIVARQVLPAIGVVPVLSPVDQEETLLTEKYVRANLEGRLASRHCRNQVRLLKSEDNGGEENRLSAFVDFLAPWLPELHFVDLKESFGASGAYLDIYYTEPGSPREKELFWAGDGIQIWFQILLHVFRLRDVDTLIFDEPEVFLHADLQRRLVRLLQELSPQAITATHSPELLAAASPPSVIWVARQRSQAVLAPDQATLAELCRAIGTQFNLKLARALRTRVAFFVEGNDMEILRNLAVTLNLQRLATEAGIAVVSLEGFSNWEHVEPFAWLTNDLLEGAVPTVVVLDRDYRPDSAVNRVKNRLGELGIESHVWELKELESYLLHAPTIAKASGASVSFVESALGDAAAGLEHMVAARLLDEVLKETVSEKKHRVTATEEFNKEFEHLWADQGRRLWLAPPDELFAAVNRALQEKGLKPVSPRPPGLPPFTSTAANPRS